jgi:tetrahydromethanopterin S-methyltransferase subunit B
VTIAAKRQDQHLSISKIASRINDLRQVAQTLSHSIEPGYFLGSAVRPPMLPFVF